MKTPLYLYLLAVLLIFSCKNEDDDAIAMDYELGKNRYTTMVDDVEREYFVHVPESYDGSSAFPVVFMLHGSSGNGNKFYNISGWKELGEVENILTVFPSSWHYCIIDDGQKKQTTKWNVQPSSWSYCVDETPRDDIQFLHTIIDELDDRFSIDMNRVYLAGFSNGGRMANKCAAEMSDVFAAITQNSGSFYRDTTVHPVRNVPLIAQFGNEEDAIMEINGGPYPLDQFEELINTHPYFQTLVNSHVNSFALDSMYQIFGDVDRRVTARFKSLDPNSNHEFLLHLVKNMTHQYPNGTNHPLRAAEDQWAWMQQYTLNN